uniref:Uncharacterized protein n=1 Tax=Arundo donax TaxID=35708 RepID=A0A0A9FQ59_ARUDO
MPQQFFTKNLLWVQEQKYTIAKSWSFTYTNHIHSADQKRILTLQSNNKEVYVATYMPRNENHFNAYITPSERNPPGKIDGLRSKVHMNKMDRGAHLHRTPVFR